MVMTFADRLVRERRLPAVLLRRPIDEPLLGRQVAVDVERLDAIPECEVVGSHANLPFE
jgi:hypothetical protein